MKLLFHAFPRAKPRGDADPAARGMSILQMILTHGMLCTPERFGVYADPQAERPEKRLASAQGRPYASIMQSRACFTLMDRHELFVANDGFGSHAGLFGPFAIGIDPVRARPLGICPVVYYYRHVNRGAGVRDGSDGDIAGLGMQIVSRLMEISNVFAILSRIEAAAHPTADWALSARMLDELDVGPKFEPLAMRRLAALDERAARRLLSYFDTDRVPAWNVVDFLQMLMSFYQTADSTLDGTPLAFFNQREWRLVHHERQGLGWIALGEQPSYRSPNSMQTAAARDELVSFLSRGRAGGDSDAEYLRHCWVLRSIDGLHFREFVREIVVPAECVADAHALLDRHEFAGPRPIVHAAYAARHEHVRRAVSVARRAA